MKVGDTVKIINPLAGHYLVIGVIVQSAKDRYGPTRKDDWMVRLETGSILSWLETNLEVVESEEALAVRILGEDYFA